jgi:hypothetical protein
MLMTPGGWTPAIYLEHESENYFHCLSRKGYKLISVDMFGFIEKLL